jgi:hypothetical protein
LDVAKTSWEEGEQADREMAVWALNSNNTLEKWYASLDPGLELIGAPTASNPNLHAQGGTFTLVRYNPINSKALTEHPPSVDDLIDSKSPSEVSEDLRRFLPALVQLCLPAKQAGNLLRLLADYQVTAAEVFPGHRGAADAIKERKWMQFGVHGDDHS